jgi:T4 beta protein
MVPAGEFSTLVALRAKRGEFAALNALSGGLVVQPLFELDGDKSSPDGELRQLEKVVRKLYGFGRLIMVDATELKVAPTVGGEKPGGLAELADILRTENLLEDEQIPFIPVVRSGLPANQIAWIGRLCDELGAGGALRIRKSGATLAEVEGIVAGLHIDIQDLDLILDLQYVEYFTPQLADWASMALDSLGSLGGFRSMTLLGGSVPATLDQTALWERPRFEEVLWRAVVHGGVRDVRLGDYGVVHPGSGPKFGSIHVNMKYTCPEHWLFVRERMKAKTDRAPTMAMVCRTLAESDSFSGADFSWGDGEISSAAVGLGKGLGSTSKPAAIGTSHHLAYLASLDAA